MKETKLKLLLDYKYDVTLDEYWTLSEEDKQELALLIVKQIHPFQNLNMLPSYLSHLDDEKLIAVEEESFEKADLLQRIRQKTIEFYG